MTKPQQPRLGEPKRQLITTTHTHAEGTLVNGTARRDGSAPVLKAHRFRWSRNLDSWYLPHTRDRIAQRHTVDDTRAALEAAGFAVAVDIDDTHRPTAAVEADREQRMSDRAAALDTKAERYEASSDAARAAADRISDAIPLGQPILIGHHSERRHRRDLDRMHRLTEQSWDDNRAARDAAQRAEITRARQDTRNTQRAVQARIERLETKRRRLTRGIEGSSHTFAGGYVETTAQATGERLDRLTAERGQVNDQLAHWRSVLAELEQAGATIYSPDNIAKGDAVQVGWGWRRVVWVNKRTVTVDDLHQPGHTGTVPYHRIKGHVAGKPTPTT